MVCYLMYTKGKGGFQNASIAIIAPYQEEDDVNLSSEVNLVIKCTLEFNFIKYPLYS